MATLYFNNAVDSDWNELGNWWEDSGFTVPASSLPTSSDDLIVQGWSVDSNTGSPAICNTALISNSEFQIPITATSITFDTCLISQDITADVTLIGSCIFTSNMFTITGNCVFNYAGFSYLTVPNGDIIGNVTCNDMTELQATVSGDIVFNDYSYFNGTATDGDYVFNDYSTNRGYITGNCVFNGLAQNQGEIIGDARFNDQSWMLTTGTPAASVSGTATWSVSAAKEALTYLSDDYYFGTIGTVVLGAGINGSSILGVV